MSLLIRLETLSDRHFLRVSGGLCALYTHTHTHKHIHTHTHTHSNTHTHSLTHSLTHSDTLSHTQKHTRARVRVYVRMYVCVPVCVCVYVWVCVSVRACVFERERCVSLCVTRVRGYAYTLISTRAVHERSLCDYIFVYASMRLSCFSSVNVCVLVWECCMLCARVDVRTILRGSVCICVRMHV
jgi:hypothetical protein